MGTDCIGSCKSNYHTSTTTTTPSWYECDKAMSKEMYLDLEYKAFFYVLME